MSWRKGESQARKVKRDLISRHESVEALLGLCWGGWEGEREVYLVLGSRGRVVTAVIPVAGEGEGDGEDVVW